MELRRLWLSSNCKYSGTVQFDTGLPLFSTCFVAIRQSENRNAFFLFHDRFSESFCSTLTVQHLQCQAATHVQCQPATHVDASSTKTKYSMEEGMVTSSTTLSDATMMTGEYDQSKELEGQYPFLMEPCLVTDADRQKFKV